MTVPLMRVAMNGIHGRANSIERGARLRHKFAFHSSYPQLFVIKEGKAWVFDHHAIFRVSSLSTKQKLQ